MPTKDVKKPVAAVVIRDFKGLMSNADRHDLPPGGAVKQVNVQTITEGELVTRGGIKKIRFD